MIKSLGLDDYVMVFAYLFYLAYLITQLVGVSYGIGQHWYNLEETRRQTALMCWWLCEVFYAPTTTLLKVSVGFFLLRICVKKIQIWIIRFFIAGSMVCGTIYLLLILFQCSPVSYWWDLNPENTGKCVSPLAFAVLSWIISVLNSFADLTFAIIPMFMVAQTTMSTRTRIAVCILLGIASIAGVVTVVRMPYIHTLNHYKGDFLWTTVEVATLTTLECGLGITAANLATFRPIIKRFQGTSRGTSLPEHSQSRRPSVPIANVELRGGVSTTAGIQKTTTYITSVSNNDGWNKPLPPVAKSESKEALNYYDDSVSDTSPV